MPTSFSLRRAGAALMLAGTISAAVAVPVAAQDLNQLSCGQLWYERNQIYAQFGYCFKTDQAIGTFGRACFPPYGRLPGWAQSRVNEIVGWERRRGCG